MLGRGNERRGKHGGQVVFVHLVDRVMRSNAIKVLENVLQTVQVGGWQGFHSVPQRYHLFAD